MFYQAGAKTITQAIHPGFSISPTLDAIEDDADEAEAEETETEGRGGDDDGQRRGRDEDDGHDQGRADSEMRCPPCGEESRAPAFRRNPEGPSRAEMQAHAITHLPYRSL